MINNNNKFSKSFFGKEQSIILGGIAILLMIWHHLFNSPSWYSDDVFVNLPELKFLRGFILVPAASGDICVQIFAIISGYALLINPKTYGNWNNRGLKLFKFLGAYWSVFALFILIGWFNNDALPSWNQFIHNLVGLKTGPSQVGVNVPFAWYVAFYIQFVILAPFLLWMFREKNIKNDSMGIMFLCIMVYFLPKLPYNGIFKSFFDNIAPVLSVGLGILAAKYKIFDKIHLNILSKFPSILIYIGIIIVLYAKYKISKINPMGGYNWAFFSTICFSILAFMLVIFLLELINRLKNKIVRNILIVFGTLSMYLWFLHGIFFTGKNFMQKELYASHEPVIIFILCLLVCTPIAYIIHKSYTFFWNKLTSKAHSTSLLSRRLH